LAGIKKPNRTCQTKRVCLQAHSGLVANNWLNEPIILLKKTDSSQVGIIPPDF
jgi:hypothetical protein